jgi:KDO2-lipid IV(A) lauroyltransferase
VRVKTVQENLELIYGTAMDPKARETLLRDNFRHYGRLLLETLVLPWIGRRRIERRVHITPEDFAPFADCLAAKKGAFLLTAHMGNWEMMCHFGASRGMRLVIVTKTFAWGWLNRLWSWLRAHPHVQYSDVSGTALELMRRAKKGEFVAMMLDQHMQPPVGVGTKFFGHEVGTIRSLALMSLRAQIPVIPVFTVRESSGDHRIYSEPLIVPPPLQDVERQVAALTQIYTSCIEGWVRRYPEQWMWLHRRFKLSHNYD